MKEFKKKLEIFEQQKEKSQSNQNNDNTSTSRCANCGDNTHNSLNCPHKTKGPLCFACKQFGHRSTDESCPLKKEETKHRIGLLRLVGNPEYQDTQEAQTDEENDE